MCVWERGGGGYYTSGIGTIALVTVDAFTDDGGVDISSSQFLVRFILS